jgi:hypothetical protein
MASQRCRLICALVLVVLYVSAYCSWSRYQYARADQVGDNAGYTFVQPRTPWLSLSNRLVVVFFSPLIALDYGLGTGRLPDVADPLYELQK